MTRFRRRFRRTDESGAILILALVFITAIATLLLAVINLSGNDLLNTVNLQSQRSIEYAADGATDAAAQWVRYTATDPTSATLCLPNGANSMTIDEEHNTPITVQVWCVAATTPPASAPSSDDRFINFTACQGNGTTECTGRAILVQAQLWFDDTASGSLTTQCSAATGLTGCGTGETIASWVVATANS